MHIDWFTVIAQALNFLVLVWLLQRFLYKPILQAIDQREALVSGRLQQATEKEAAAEQKRQQFQQQQQALEQQKASMLAQTEEAAKAEKQRLLQQAQQEAAALRAQLRQTLQKDQEHWGQEVARQVRQEAFAIARKVLTDLSDTTLEEHMTAVFLQRLQKLPPEQVAHLRPTTAQGQQAAIASAFPLASPQQAALEQAVQRLTGQATPVKFETDPNLLAGLELTLNGNRLSWSTQDYVASMEERLAEQLEQKPGPDGKPQQPTTVRSA